MKPDLPWEALRAPVFASVRAMILLKAASPEVGGGITDHQESCPE